MTVAPLLRIEELEENTASLGAPLPSVAEPKRRTATSRKPVTSGLTENQKALDAEADVCDGEVYRMSVPLASSSPDHDESRAQRDLGSPASNNRRLPD